MTSQKPPDKGILRACVTAMVIHKLGKAMGASVCVKQTRRTTINIVLARILRRLPILSLLIYLVRQQISFWKNLLESFNQRPRYELLILRNQWFRELAKSGIWVAVCAYLLYWLTVLKRERKELLPFLGFTIRIILEKLILGRIM